MRFVFLHILYVDVFIPERALKPRKLNILGTTLRCIHGDLIRSSRSTEEYVLKPIKYKGFYL